MLSPADNLAFFLLKCGVAAAVPCAKVPTMKVRKVGGVLYVKLIIVAIELLCC